MTPRPLHLLVVAFLLLAAPLALAEEHPPEAPPHQETPKHPAAAPHRGARDGGALGPAAILHAPTAVAKGKKAKHGGADRHVETVAKAKKAVDLMDHVHEQGSKTMRRIDRVLEY